MRIAYLTSLYARGTDSFIRGEVLRLREIGFDVRTFSIRKPGAEEATDESIRKEQAQTRYLLDGHPLRLLTSALASLLTNPVRCMWSLLLSWSVSPPGLTGKTLAFAYWVEAAALARELRAQGIEHLHNHIGQNSATVAMLAAGIADIPYSITIHGPLEFDRPQALALSTKVARSAFTIAISDYGRSQLMRWTPPAAWNRIKVLRCGVAPEFLNEPVTPPVADARLVCIGRLAEQKGIPVLLLAAKRLRDMGRKFELVIVGNGPLRESIERDIAAAGLQDCVRLAGLLSPADVKYELLRSRAIVLPSFAEGLPVVIMEALALGRPAISTYIAGIPELVRPGETGWLVPAGSEEKLAHAMASALDADSDDLARMGVEGAAVIRRDHDQRAQAAKLAQHFRTAASLLETDRGHATPTIGLDDRADSEAQTAPS